MDLSAPDVCGKITMCFVKGVILILVQALAFTKSLLVYQQIFMTRYSLTTGTSSTHQWVRAIPGQIILVMCTPLKLEIYYSCP